jgi:glycogen operon protein
MILAGDEAGRTQFGNNNPFCQDNETSWFDWNLLRENAGLVRFFRLLIQFRKTHSILRRGTFSPANDLLSPRVEWHGSYLHEPNWSSESRSLAMHLHGCPEDKQEHLYLIMNAFWEPIMFELPIMPGWQWMRSIDTSYPSPLDIVEPGAERCVEAPFQYEAGPRSVVVFSARRR